MDAFEILVVILSSVFALMLVGLTISTFIFVKILRDIRHITEKATLAVDHIENAAEFFKNTSGSAAVFKMIGNVVESFRKKGKKS